MEEKNLRKELSRRGFLKGAALGAGAVAAATMLGPASSEAAPIPKKWDKTADVVVVGAGFAGFSAAITAHDAGAKVLLIEKASEEKSGGNSRVCLQLWFNPMPVEGAITYQKALNGPYTVPDDVLRAWAEEKGKNNDFVKSLGGTPVESPPGPPYAPEFPELPGAESCHVFSNGEKWGHSRLYELMKPNVLKRGIKVLYETPGKKLVQNPKTGEILGVIADQKGKSISIKAKKAVVLTCGGFENNQEMVRDYLPNMPACYPFGTPYNTGDGIKMALDVGADLWHMSNIAGPGFKFKNPELKDITHYINMPSDNYIFVGADGTRFVNEAGSARHGKIKRHGQWVPTPTPVPVYYIFDEAVRAAGPLCNTGYKTMGWAYLVEKVRWSKDNNEEISKGWIIKADTISELARKIHLDPKTLEKTVATWNGYCKSGKDLEWGRRPKTLKPIETPPYYALENVPYFINTQGGPRRNAKGQIVRPDGTAIPRLYSAGELGSVYSFCYNGGGNVGECMAFGRISGRNAAALKPWG